MCLNSLKRYRQKRRLYNGNRKGVARRKNYNICNGRLDIQTAPEFQDELDEIIGEEKTNLVLDLKEVDYVSSAGLRAILYIQKKLDTIEGSTMIVKNVCPDVMEVFEMTGFTEFLKIENSQEESHEA